MVLLVFKNSHIEKEIDVLPYPIEFHDMSKIFKYLSLTLIYLLSLSSSKILMPPTFLILFQCKYNSFNYFVY